MTLTVSSDSTESIIRTSQSPTAQLLVLRYNVRTRRPGVQLLASIPLPQRILRLPRTPPRQIGRTGTPPGR